MHGINVYDRSHRISKNYVKLHFQILALKLGSQTQTPDRMQIVALQYMKRMVIMTTVKTPLSNMNTTYSIVVKYSVVYNMVFICIHLQDYGACPESI